MRPECIRTIEVTFLFALSYILQLPVYRKSFDRGSFLASEQERPHKDNGWLGPDTLRTKWDETIRKLLDHSLSCGSWLSMDAQLARNKVIQASQNLGQLKDAWDACFSWRDVSCPHFLPIVHTCKWVISDDAKTTIIINSLHDLAGMSELLSSYVCTYAKNYTRLCCPLEAYNIGEICLLQSTY